MTPFCFIDFDGTLVDNKFRLYHFFYNNIPQEYKMALSINEFWQLKRLGVNEVDWINDHYDVNIDKEKWEKKKRNDIEKHDYIMLNHPFEYAIESLKELTKKYELILLTRRSKSESLMEEIDRYNMSGFFRDIRVIPHGEVMKADVIREYPRRKGDILIGDTEDDFLAGLDAGIISYMVLSGIRDRWIVAKYRLIGKVIVVDDTRGVYEKRRNETT